MFLREEAKVTPEALPVAAFRDHLRLGTGFADDGVQDAVLEGCLRAALGRIEARCGKAVLRRRFSWRIGAWREAARQVLPRAPVSAVVSLALTDRFGAVAAVEAGRYRLAEDMHRPALVATGAALPAIPVGGSAEVVFEAGFGVWADVPGDLAQAVLLLAAEFYEHRHDAGRAAVALPVAVAGLLEPWRGLRIGGGA
ncbi:head-tail connector protein [Tranquillimonas alkanivorans]|uniref:Phage gp6-like head-tail connector protein n=1 Tax=Tranquillimonas alkanivorans TaxID=441119 RepID=A0A1I5QRQ8_9RHOB|nr:hypothetical protein [Tranquillimonas alkanivorans]SFP48949.1 phage conserved hypothetical protein, phiE125 gp8 family [Tranquillimonas alkanivorans]